MGFTVIEFKPSSLSGLHLKIVIVGDSGDGKSTTALRLAKGMAQGGRILVIDTDNGRANLNHGLCEFDTYNLKTPCNGDDYSEAVKAAIKLNPAVVIVDSVSEEHRQMLQDYADHMDRGWKNYKPRPGQKVLSEYEWRNKMSMSGWLVAKDPRNRLADLLRAIPCHHVLTMRAGMKLNVDTKKKEMDLEGFPGFIKDATASFLLRPNQEGKPDWHPARPLSGCTKVATILKGVFSDKDCQLTEAHGLAMVQALGATASRAKPEPELDPQEALRAIGLRIDECSSITELKQVSRGAGHGLDETSKDMVKAHLTKRKAQLEEEEREEEAPREREPGED